MATKTNTKINGKDYFRVTLDLGYDANGKRIRKQFYGKSKKEAESKREEYKLKLRVGINTDKKLYLGKAMHDWLYEVVKVGQIKPSSFDKYDGLYRNYYEHSPLAVMQLDKIESINIQRYYNDLFKGGKSSNVIKNANKLLKQFFNYCQDNNYILNNPTSGKKIIIPTDPNKTIKKNEVEVFTNDEIKAMLNLDETTSVKHAAIISFATGMRKGEILGLKSSDFDFINNEISIERSVTTASIIDDDGKKHKKTYISDPKTFTSLRTIPLPKSLIKVIKNQIALRNEMILKNGISIEKEYKDLLFLSQEGNLINAGNFDRSWGYFLKRCNVSHKKFHCLRHTYATRQFENGTPVLTVSKLLGHSKIDITLDIYTHVLKKEKEKAVDTLSLLNF